MSSILISLLPIFLAWIVFRVTTRAVVPLLADVRAGGAHQARLTLGRYQSQAPLHPRRLLQAAVVAAIAMGLHWLLVNLRLVDLFPQVAFDLRTGFFYRYYPSTDFVLVAALAIGVKIFSRGWRSALLAFAFLYALLFAYDLAFNVVGALTFQTEVDFYFGVALGQNLWVVYYAIYGALVAAGLSIFMARFRAFLPWVTLATAGAVSAFLITQQMVGPLTALGISYVLPHILIAAVSGWWMGKQGSDS